jgi:aspartyl-tRNA(Asn)/glutamyl-tRNA(Gln) amidotransferase subunit C
MSKLSRDDVLKLALLSRLKLTDEEVERFAGDLSSILEYVEKLDAVDTSGHKPTYQVTGLKNITREDKTRDYGYKTEDLLKNAPSIKDNQFKVKRVL